MITPQQAQALMQHALGAATRLGTSSTMNVGADYLAYSLNESSVPTVQPGSLAGTLDILAEAESSSCRELYLSDGDVIRERHVWTTPLHLLLSPQPVAIEDSDARQGQLVYVGHAQAGAVSWRIAKGLYPASHTAPAISLRCDGTVQAVLADYPHLLWWTQ